MFCKYLLALIMITGCCRPETECSDIDYGATSFLQTTESFVPYWGKQILVFKDSLDHELTFLLSPRTPYIHTWLYFHQPLQEGECAGQAEVTGDIEFFNYHFESDSLEYEMRCMYQVNYKIIDDVPIFFESMRSFMRGDPQDSIRFYVEIEHRTNDRGNEAYFQNEPKLYTFHDKLILRNKEFENVFVNVNQGEGNLLYINHEFGFLAFKDSGKTLWVLDRIE